MPRVRGVRSSVDLSNASRYFPHAPVETREPHIVLRTPLRRTVALGRLRKALSQLAWAHAHETTQKPLRLLRRAIVARVGRGTSSSTLSVDLERRVLPLRSLGASLWEQRRWSKLAGCRIGAAVRGEVLRELPYLSARDS